ncbi:MAG: SPFH domain-containing protein, partial [Vallitaleaceae bacterium]|nr:SPFH domain-containing protein [Vallitaleaceae bacterium]
MEENRNEVNQEVKEQLIHPKSGGLILIGILLGFIIFIVTLIMSIVGLENGKLAPLVGVSLIILSILLVFIVLPILCGGLKILNPNEALVLTLFGKYYGTIAKEGFFFV